MDGISISKPRRFVGCFQFWLKRNRRDFDTDVEIAPIHIFSFTRVQLHSKFESVIVSEIQWKFSEFQ